jgi:hypothetical protein
MGCWHGEEESAGNPEGLDVSTKKEAQLEKTWETPCGLKK